jgi:hypothetical protein
MERTTEEFSRLSLAEEEEMTFSSTPLRERKITVVDILSSIERDILPSEYRPEVVAEIDEKQAQRDASERTVLQDLAKTVLLWGCHDEIAWQAINQFVPADTRALLFTQKLNRRFREQFERYDDLSISPLGQNPSLQRRAEDIHSRVEAIAVEMRHLARAAATDLRQRRRGKVETLRVLLRALKGVCEKRQDICSVLRSSLYHHLIHGTAPNGPFFALEPLNEIKGLVQQTQMPSEMKQNAQEIATLLRASRAPKNYQIRFGTIADALNAESAGPAQPRRPR